MSYLLGNDEINNNSPNLNTINVINNSDIDTPYLFTDYDGNNSDDNGDDTVTDTSNIYTPDLFSRTLKVTVETLLKNIASYNYKTDMSDRKYHIKTYYLEDNKKINITVDMKDSKHIIYKISGDTNYDKVLIKDIVIKDDEIITTYLEGEDNAG